MLMATDTWLVLMGFNVAIKSTDSDKEVLLRL